MNAIRTWCTRNDLIFIAEPREDHGIDAYIELVRKPDHPTGFVVAAQVKSGMSHIEWEDARHLRMRLVQRDVHYWLGANMPVFVVLHLESRGQTYAKLLDEELQPMRTRATTCICFDKGSDLLCSEFAERLRVLAAQSPNRLHRAAVLGDPVVAVKPGPSWSPAAAPNQENDWLAGAIVEGTRLVGVTTDGGHAMEIRWRPLGQKCDTFSMVLHDVARCTEREAPLFTEHDFDSDCDPNIFPAARLATCREVYARYGMVPPHAAFERAGVVQHDETLPRHCDVVFVCGGIEFELSIQHRSRLSGLAVRPLGFQLHREHWLLRDVYRPALVGIDDEDIEKPQALVHLQRLYCVPASGEPSDDTGWLGLTLVYNAEHMCWGNTQEVLVFISFDTIREACLATLR